MIVILSAKYTEQDLRIEFGSIPPTFLPVGNKRLYHYQIESIRKTCPEETIFLTLPKNFELDQRDKLELDSLNINIIYINHSFSLGQSLAFCLSSVVKNNHDNVTIYYGDTFLKNGLNPIQSNDIIYTSKSDFNYVWQEIPKNSFYDKQIFCGVFSITHPLTFINCLIDNNFEFENSIKLYHETFNFVLEKRSDWLDFGHLNTFYDSKTIVTTQRAFNNLKITKHYVEKSSHKSKKLEAEANWFKNIPEELVYFTPRLISTFKDTNFFSYKIDYLYCPTLTEIFVFGKHPLNIWTQILKSCFLFLEKCKKIKGNSVFNFKESLIQKNIERLNEFIFKNPCYSNEIIDEDGKKFNLMEILQFAHNQIHSTNATTFVHGDFCFSNILFDFQKNCIKVIDPRGVDFNNNLNIYGDIRYDLAKLVHSAIGHYDFIVSDRYSIKEEKNKIILELPSLQTDISSQIVDGIEKLGYSYKEILAITTTLFLSMLPLHYDKPNRQKAFIAIAVKLFKELKNDNYSYGRS